MLGCPWDRGHDIWEPPFACEPEVSTPPHDAPTMVGASLSTHVPSRPQADRLMRGIELQRLKVDVKVRLCAGCVAVASSDGC